MVDQNYIHQIESLQNGQLPSFDMEEMEKLCRDYPCFQSAFLLKAVYLKQKDAAVFEENLPELAVRVLNRSVLYDRVHQKYNNLLEKEPLSKKPAIQEPIINLETKQEEAQIDEELSGIIEKAEILHAEEVNVLEDKEEETQALTDDVDNLKALVDEISRKRKEAPIVTKTPPAQLSKPKQKASKKQKAPQKSKEELKAKQIEEKPTSFTDWLKNKKTIDQNSIQQKEPIIPLDMAVAHEAELMREVKKSNLKLEDFLVNQIERRQSKKEQGQSAFKHAVSETYAQILVKQGKIEDAIAIYKELSIKYPKKSSSFARQIENLKNSL